ncbi:MAG: ABC transporter permease [Lachnospiraceae bacterium]|nr:ABC transporter permease [Lachnospiraceae bacterium]
MNKERMTVFMKLYKMEIYKLCCRKLFIVGAAAVMLIVLLTFWVQVMDEEATINDTKYTGYPAVKINRQITEEFKGVMTDEKAAQIVEKYGFPEKLEEGWYYFRDANFLNEFVMDYLTDAYVNSLDDYRVATFLYPIAESDLGAVMEITGKEIILEYYKGWKAFVIVLYVGMVVGSILVIFAVSPLFANERQIRMLSLLFTAKEGKKKDVVIKIGAALTVSVCIWAVIFLLDLLLCGVVYGLDGLNCYNGMVLFYMLPWPKNMIPMPKFILMVLLLSFFGIFSLCAITMCISALCNSSFHAVTMAAVCWGAPVLIAMFMDGFHGIGKLLTAAPVFMVIGETIDFIYDIWLMPIGIAVFVSIFCVFWAYRKYRGQQAC